MSRRHAWITLAAIGIPILFITTIYLTGRTTEMPIPQNWTINDVVERCGKPFVVHYDFTYKIPDTLIYRADHGDEIRIHVIEGNRVKFDQWDMDQLSCLAKTR